MGNHRYAAASDSRIRPGAAHKASPEHAQADAIVRTLQGANLRTGPELEFAVVAVVPAGHAVWSVGQSPDQEWLRLARGSWIWSALVDSPPSPLPVLETEATVPGSIVVPAGTALSAGPSSFHASLSVAQPEQLFTVSGRNRAGTWLGVRATGTSNDQWVPVDLVAYPFMELLPVLVSAAAPDTEALFDFLMEHAAKQTGATHSVSVQVQACGRAHAFAVKRAGRKYVVLCQEMLTLMWQDFASLEAAFPSALEYTTAAASGILAVALHELGHLWLEDPRAVRGLDNLGRSIAQAQEIATRYGTTFGEDVADLYATVVLQEMVQALGAQADTRAALPTAYVALGPVLLGYVTARHRPGSGRGTHSPSPERLATSLCVGGDGMGPVFALTLDRVAGFRERLYDLPAARGRQCLDSSEPDPEAYAALRREIEELFAASLPAWW